MEKMEFDIITVLRKARISKGISQKELSERTGISTGTLCRMEQYKLFPQHRTLMKISEALGVDLETSNYKAGRIEPSELLKAAQPLIDLLRKKGNPMMIVQVTDEGADLFSAECGTGKRPRED